MADVEILGIRHHGPGSARSVLAALDEVRPDLVLIEGPPELDGLIAAARHPGLVPPVAALVYDPQTPRRAAFYPLANFSPEWVTLRWAIEHAVDVRFADLAAMHVLAMDDEAEGSSPSDGPSDSPAEGAPDGALGDEQPGDDQSGDEQSGERSGDEQSGEQGATAAVEQRPDAIAMLARIAGYDDPEQWWEDAVEQRHESAVADFRALTEAISMAREAVTDEPILLQREAAMRKILRAAMKTHERIAVVCGAYHAPALVPAAFPKQAADNALLAKLPKTKVTATWAPWTSRRLANASGYGAGVTSPGWYAHLFEQWQSGSTDTSATWLVRMAHALREADLAAPPASVVEATRLADALAAIRGRPSAGLTELEDSAVATLLDGHRTPLALIHDALVVGRELGTVPPDTPMVPLAADLLKQQKSLRLKRSVVSTQVSLDLRAPSGLAKSQLFHRLLAIGLDWALPGDAGGTKGSFKEVWQLEWQPDFEVKLIEAGLHGTTVRDAAAALLLEGAANADSLAQLAEHLDSALLADLPDALDEVVRMVGTRAAQQADVGALLEAVEPLAGTLRYGDVRQLPVAGLHGVVTALVRRACVGLRAACQGLDDAAAAEMSDALGAAQRGLTTLHDESLTQTWKQALATVGADDAVHGLVSGLANRLLYDAGEISVDEAGRRMSLRLSIGASPTQGAAWLDGFLSGEAILLTEEVDLLAIIDAWLADVPDALFGDLFPLLRRTFGRFSQPERRQIGERVAHLGTDRQIRTTNAEWDDDAARAPIATVARLLGLTLEEAR